MEAYRAGREHYGFDSVGVDCVSRTTEVAWDELPRNAKGVRPEGSGWCTGWESGAPMQ